MSDNAGDRDERRRQTLAAIVVGVAAVAATVGTLLWSFWALVIAPVVAMVVAVRLGGRGELRVSAQDDGLRVVIPPTEATTRHVVSASLAFLVAFAIPSLITTAVEGLIPSSPIVVFVGVFTLLGIALAVRALVPTVVSIERDSILLRRGRADRRIPFEAIARVERDGPRVTIDAGEVESATITCAGPRMADAVTTRLRDAMEERRAT